MILLKLINQQMKCFSQFVFFLSFENFSQSPKKCPKPSTQHPKPNSNQNKPLSTSLSASLSDHCFQLTNCVVKIFASFLKSVCAPVCACACVYVCTYPNFITQFQETKIDFLFFGLKIFKFFFNSFFFGFLIFFGLKLFFFLV